MSRRTDLIAKGFEAYNAGRVTADDPFVVRLADDVEWHAAIADVRGTPYRGPAGYLRWYADVQEAFERPRISAVELREVGDRVLALARFTATGRISGVQIDETVLHVYDFRPDGTIRRCEAHLNPGADLLAQTGWTER